MAEPKHAREVVAKCDVQGCSDVAERSVPGKKVEKSGLSISSDPDKNAHLCRAHYREFKKRTKKDRELERMGW